MTSLSVIRTAAELSEFAPLWDALLEKSLCDKVFLGWDWISNWIGEMTSGADLLVVVVHDDGELVALAPLFVEKVSYWGIFELRVLKPIGAGISDYFDWIVRADGIDKWTKAIWEHLVGPLARQWDVFEFLEVPETSPVLHTLQRIAGSDYRCVGAMPIELKKCPYIELPGSWEEFLKSRSGTRRYSFSYSRRKLAGQGDLQLRFCQTADELPAQMEALISLNKESWRERGGSDSFSSPALERFHQRVARACFDRGMLFLCTLRLDGEHIASFYGFEYRRRVYYYISAVKRNTAKRVNVLDALLGFCVEEAMKRGNREFDLLRGDEEYKSRWTPLCRRNVSICFHNRTKRSMALRLYRGCRRRVNHRAVR